MAQAKLVRLQTWVTPQQKAKVRTKARREKVSESALMRAIIDHSI
jgi:hypothetical protein